jgi:tetratricopeptide (TPR) repeat protein
VRLLRVFSVVLVIMFLAVGCAKQVANQGPSSEQASGGHSLQHTVVKGETLRQIADNYYGDPELAVKIAAGNGITDPNRIVPGSVLLLEFDDGQWRGAQKRSVALEAYNKGVDMMGQDRLAEAEKQFRLALDTAPGLQSANYNLALVLSRRGKNSEALSILQELLAEKPDDTDFLFACGHCLFQLTRFSEASHQFQAVLKIDGGHKRAAFGLARSLQEDGQDQKAMGAWKRYLDLDSTSGWADVARRNYQKLRDGS